VLAVLTAVEAVDVFGPLLVMLSRQVDDPALIPLADLIGAASSLGISGENLTVTLILVIALLSIVTLLKCLITCIVAYRQRRYMRRPPNKLHHRLSRSS